MMADFKGIFGAPFKEQLAAWRLRMGDLVPTKRWDDMVRASHDRAFMVAGAMKADLLADLAKAVDKSIAEGRGLEEFRKDFRAIVARHGWAGWTGEGTKAGEAWRTRVIYKTNMMTTYHAGRWAQLRAAGFKFWVYFHGGSLEPRLHHLAWDGLILPANHPFWQTHYPPNGWGCSCYVSGAHTYEGAKRLGGKPGLELPPDWAKRTPKTGAPAGIDKNWDYAPGASTSDTARALAPNIQKLPAPIGNDLLASWLAHDIFARWFAKPTGFWPVTRVSPALQAKIGAEARLVNLSAYTVQKQGKNHPDLTLADYRLIGEILANPLEIIRDKKGGNNSWIVIGHAGRRKYRVVVKIVPQKSELFVTSLIKISHDPRKAERALTKRQRN